jgi:hypothetical protein
MGKERGDEGWGGVGNVDDDVDDNDDEGVWRNGYPGKGI